MELPFYSQINNFLLYLSLLHIIIPMLENLAAQDETVVRDAAIKSLISITKDMDDNEI